MKLLFDHNLSPHLVHRLADLFPVSQHVLSVSLATAFDTDLWSFAQQHGYTIVTKDADFIDLSVLRGHPPKVIWIRLGNCTTDTLERVLRQQAVTILRDRSID